MCLVSVVIPTYNMNHLIKETIKSVLAQSHKEIEIIVYDDCSTDGTAFSGWVELPAINYILGKKNKGVGAAFNAGIRKAKGKYVFLMCADDLLTSRHVIKDMVRRMENDPALGYLSRWYYQFIKDVYHPVRAWRTMDPIIQANNPSGLMFRKRALNNAEASNKMFIETSALASEVINNGWNADVVQWDTVGVRVHGSTSTQPEYWLKRRVSSPVMDWMAIGGKDIAKDYVSFIQIKNGFYTSAVWEEIVNFAKVRPRNLYNPKYYFWALVALTIPRRILRKLPPFYRKHIGSKITTIKRRPLCQS